jgi:two-component system OmpR family response regulator
MQPTILLVDDDANLREVVRYALDRAGFVVTEAADGLEALVAFRETEPDLVVLDVLMPELDGLEVCRRIRQTSQVPIVFLSSRGEEVDRILGLDLGGDDYVTKPFSARELVSRIRAVLRRTSGASGTSRLVLGPVVLDSETWRVEVRGEAVELTVTEFRLLEVLARRPGRVFPRDALIARAYPGQHHVSARTVDSHVRRIRQKLRATGLECIETVHGLGFRFVQPK